MAKKFSIPGFNRYYFTLDGKCFSSLTDKELSISHTKWGAIVPYYRPINDEGVRTVVYVSNIKALCKEQSKKEKPKAKELPPGFDILPKKRGLKMSPEQIIELRSEASRGIKSKVLAAKYKLNVATVSKIIKRKIYPDIK